MSTELMTQEQVAALQLHTEEEFAALAALSQSFLPRLQLGGGNSDAVKEGKLPIAHWGLFKSKDECEDLGSEVDIFILAWQPKAMDTSSDPPLVNVDAKSEEFIRIRDESGKPDSGCMFGPEYLVYIPDVQTFATLFMCSKTARREAGNVQKLIGKAATLKSKYIKTAKYSWHGPVCVPSEAIFTMPTPEEIQDARKKFTNTVPSGVEKVEAPSGDRER